MHGVGRLKSKEWLCQVMEKILRRGPRKTNLGIVNLRSTGQHEVGSECWSETIRRILGDVGKFPPRLLVDAYLPGMSRLSLLRQLRADGRSLPSVMITGMSDVSTAVEAMKVGAMDFVEKPVSREGLINCVEHAFALSRDANSIHAQRDTAAAQLVDLTPRQRQIMEMVVAGRPSKIIAEALNISQRTVENHRAMIMKKTGSRSLPALARLGLHASTAV